MTPAWQGELRLGFLDPDRVTFFRHPDDEMPGLELGKRYAVVLVEIQNDETAAPTTGKAGLGRDQASGEGKPTRIVHASNRAALLCKDERFQQWVWKRYRYPKTGIQVFDPSEMLARDYVLTKCKIDSRSALDRDRWAAADFMEIEVAFYRWVAAGGYTGDQDVHARAAGRACEAGEVGEVHRVGQDAPMRESAMREAGSE